MCVCVCVCVCVCEEKGVSERDQRGVGVTVFGQPDQPKANSIVFQRPPKHTHILNMNVFFFISILLQISALLNMTATYY